MIDQAKQYLTEALQAANETRRLEIGSNILQDVPTVFREVFGDRSVVVIVDENTFSAAGEAVHSAFRASSLSSREPFIFSAGKLYAGYESVTELEAALRKHDAIPVAVGAGTINDLTKLAAFLADRPYMCVATAASMDGYTAFGASITRGGLKQTFTCPAPRAVVADLDVIRKAPGSMNAWGYADLLAKVTAGADWIVADALGVERIDPYAWSIVQGRLRELVADPAGVRAGSSSVIGSLVEGLMLGGFAMQSARSSRPASGAEHQFSHLWDMQHHTYNGATPSHGFKVGIGTLAVTALYECLFSLPLEKLDVDRCCAACPGDDAWQERVRLWHSDGGIADGAWAELNAKRCDVRQLRELLGTLRQVWLELRGKLRRQLIPLPELKRMLVAAGAPTEPEDIGISRERLRESYWKAFSIRRRFTVLDLAVRAGVLDECLDRIFGPGGVWPQGEAVRTSESAVPRLPLS